MTVLSYLAVYLIWGAAYFASDVAMTSLSPATVIWTRYLLGALGCLVLLPFAPPPVAVDRSCRRLGGSVLSGLLLFLGGTGLVTWGMVSVESHLAAVLVASMPLVIALIEAGLRHRPLPWTKAAGILIGLAGVALLLHRGPGLSFHPDPGILRILAGVILWGAGTALNDLIRPSGHLLLNSTVQMSAASFPLLVFEAATGRMPSPQAFIGDPAVLAASLFLSLGGAVAILAFNHLLKNEPPLRVASYVFVNPLVAILLGLLIGKERPTPMLLPGFLLILLGLVLAMVQRAGRR